MAGRAPESASTWAISEPSRPGPTTAIRDEGGNGQLVEDAQSGRQRLGEHRRLVRHRVRDRQQVGDRQGGVVGENAVLAEDPEHRASSGNAPARAPGIRRKSGNPG